jgi:hypothetical protein
LPLTFFLTVLNSPFISLNFSCTCWHGPRVEPADDGARVEHKHKHSPPNAEVGGRSLKGLKLDCVAKEGWLGPRAEALPPHLL